MGLGCGLDPDLGAAGGSMARRSRGSGVVGTVRDGVVRCSAWADWGKLSVLGHACSAMHGGISVRMLSASSALLGIPGSLYVWVCLQNSQF